MSDPTPSAEPLTPEEEQRVRFRHQAWATAEGWDNDGHTQEHPETECSADRDRARLLATLDAARSEPSREEHCCDESCLHDCPTCGHEIDHTAAFHAPGCLPSRDPRAEVEALRRQNHEHAERRDREMAALQSQVGRYRNAYERAKELVRGSPIDWSSDPVSQSSERLVGLYVTEQPGRSLPPPFSTAPPRRQRDWTWNGWREQKLCARPSMRSCTRA
jgi:hypothetical protein